MLIIRILVTFCIYNSVYNSNPNLPVNMVNVILIEIFC